MATPENLRITTATPSEPGWFQRSKRRVATWKHAAAYAQIATSVSIYLLEAARGVKNYTKLALGNVALLLLLLLFLYNVIC